MKDRDHPQQPDAHRPSRRTRWAGRAWVALVLLLCLGLVAPPTPAQDSAGRSRPTPTCAGQAAGTACWTELASQAGCYVWNGHALPDASVTWSGACTDGLAHGDGSLTWVWGEDKKVVTMTGRLQAGQQHGGPWVERLWDGDVYEGPYVEGQRHGHWVLRKANGDVHEGPFVEGKKHGPWVERLWNGDVYEGPFVEGKQHGLWVIRFADGNVWEGPFVEGKRHGPWVWRWPDGRVEEESYVHGERQ